MNLFQTFATKPSARITKLLLLASIILMIVVYPVMGYYFMASGDTVNIMISQLSFSDAFLKWQYALMTAAGLETYRTAQSFDYLYMVSYGLLSFALALIIGRRFDEQSAWRKMGFLFAVIGPLAACFDAVENIFILLSLTDPSNFPAWWAIVHSTCALVKWLLLGLSVGWAIIAVLYHVIIARKKT
jgi:hypothetical protein